MFPKCVPTTKNSIYSLDGIIKHPDWVEVTLMDHTHNRLLSRKGNIKADEEYPIWISLENTKVLVPDMYAVRFKVDPSSDAGRVFL